MHEPHPERKLSTIVEHIKFSDALKICNRIIFDFIPRLPQLYSSREVLDLHISTIYDVVTVEYSLVKNQKVPCNWNVAKFNEVWQPRIDDHSQVNIQLFTDPLNPWPEMDSNYSLTITMSCSEQQWLKWWISKPNGYDFSNLSTNSEPHNIMNVLGGASWQMFLVTRLILQSILLSETSWFSNPHPKTVNGVMQLGLMVLCWLPVIHCNRLP